ncbi:MAG: type IV pilus biogenesis/stability protein PilW [Duganella sp.]
MAGSAQRGRFSLVTRGMFPLLAGALAGCVATSDTVRSVDSAPFSASSGASAERKAAIRMQLAVGYFEQGQYAVALDEVKLALASGPDNAEALGLRGLIEQALGQTVAADESFRRARRLAPGNPDLANNYGAFLCQNGRVAEAMPLFDAALANRAYRTPASAANNAGGCALNIKDYASAERYLLQALQLTPDLPATNANLARLYVEKRDLERAHFFVTRLGEVAKMESLTADVLWLGIKVQHRVGDTGAQSGWVTQLRSRYPGSTEYAAYQRGAFDE